MCPHANTDFGLTVLCTMCTSFSLSSKAPPTVSPNQSRLKMQPSWPTCKNRTHHAAWQAKLIWTLTDTRGHSQACGVQNGCVDSDQPTPAVEQRSTAVSRVDGGILQHTSVSGNSDRICQSCISSSLMCDCHVECSSYTSELYKLASDVRLPCFTASCCECE